MKRRIIFVFPYFLAFLFIGCASNAIMTTYNPQDIAISVNNVSFIMKKVEGGTFFMGSQKRNYSERNYNSDADDDESPVHQVTLSDFYICNIEVTQKLWKTVMGNNPSKWRGDMLPVDNVSWNDCQEFIIRLNQITGRNFRLPTEAEWEYAARGGNRSREYKYSGSNILEEIGWYEENSRDRSHPVGRKQPNELGIYDMTGNVMEWCEDWYGDYSARPQTNPRGPSDGIYRVVRGGNWCIPRDGCVSTWRARNYPNSRGPQTGQSVYGLRLVLVP